MSKLLQVRHVPDEVHAELRRRATEAGVSLSDYVLRELERVAARPLMAEVFARAASRRIDIPLAEIVEGIRSDRDAR